MFGHYTPVRLLDEAPMPSPHDSGKDLPDTFLTIAVDVKFGLATIGRAKVKQDGVIDHINSFLTEEHVKLLARAFGLLP